MFVQINGAILIWREVDVEVLLLILEIIEKIPGGSMLGFFPF